MEHVDQQTKLSIHVPVRETLAGEPAEGKGLQKVLQLLVEELQRAGVEGGAGESQKLVFELAVNGIHYSVVRNGKAVEEEKNNLSPREKEIVRLIARGLPNKAIAGVLDLSPWTVASHLRRIYIKLGVKSRAEMIAHLYEAGQPDNQKD